MAVAAGTVALTRHALKMDGSGFLARLCGECLLCFLLMSIQVYLGLQICKLFVSFTEIVVVFSRVFCVSM